MDKTIEKKIYFEIEQIDELMEVSRPFLSTCLEREPEFGEKCGVAQILHSFYNGIEKLLLLIVKNSEIISIDVHRWHSELFMKAFEPRNNKSIIRPQLKEILNEYLKFRHVVRNSYGFTLNWDKMIDMVTNLEKTWNMIKCDILDYIK